MQRGVNQQQILEDREDNEKFIRILRKCKSISGFKLYAYCLMGNHIHLVMKVEDEPLDKILKRICIRYVYWYNAKYHRVGHLFQGRFKSEAIESERSFLRVLRYVHQNPVKAGMVIKPGDYQYSSYNCYLDPQRDSLVDTEFALGLMSREQFVEFHSQANEDKYLDMKERSFRLTDERAKEIIRKVTQCENASEFQRLEVKVRNSYIRQLRAAGLSIRQISRLTGISKGVVEKCKL